MKLGLDGTGEKCWTYFMYDGYIERVYSTEVRKLIEENMINRENMRPQLKKAMTHVNTFRTPWKTRFEKNIRKILQNNI